MSASGPSGPLVSKLILSGIPPECQTVWIQIVRPDMGPNCLQRLSADNTSRQRECIIAIIASYIYTFFKILVSLCS